MAEAEYQKFVCFLATVIMVALTAGISISDAQTVDKNCTCQNINSNFDEVIKAEVHLKCRKCFKFMYDFSMDQNWTARVCVKSKNVSHHSPILVVVREYFSALSFSVPEIDDDGKKSSFTDVCHTLCPLANYFDEKLDGSTQNIYVEISSQNEVPVEFEVRLSKLRKFIITTHQSMTVNVTPSQPHVMQYNMEEYFDAVRVEARSSDSSCTVLAVQDIRCPFSDFDNTVPHYSGFYQTFMKQSGVSITRKFFPMGQVYVVLVLKATNEECIECCESDENKIKEVTVNIVSPISDSKFDWGIGAPLLFYFIVFYCTALGYYWCCRRTSLPYSCCKEVENETLSSELELRNTEAGLPQSSSLEGKRQKIETLPSEITPLNAEAERRQLPPVEDRLNTRNVCFVSDLAQEDEEDLNKRSKLYTWNLGIVAIFYCLPVFQLVYMNQGIVNLTGNQDLCYYNFLCARQWWMFSDFNHVWSNIGYIMMGILFLIVVKKRDSVYKETVLARVNMRKDQITGIGNFGLYHAMGLALIMEGFLSACYHVCPNQTNFQFDMTFMYVICMLSMLKIYQNRHPDCTLDSHAAWMILALLIIVTFFGEQFGRKVSVSILIFLCIGHLAVTFYVIFNIYFIKNRNQNMKYWEVIKKDWNNENESYKRHNRARLTILTVIAVLNIIGIIVAGAVQLTIPMYILAFFMGNLFLYVIYYMIMKTVNGEGVPWYSGAYSVVAVVLWVIAVDHFRRVRAQWEVTPAQSREQNVHCISGFFGFYLGFYDDHDVWHFCSSIAIFFSYLVPFTLDDNLEETHRNQIIVF